MPEDGNSQCWGLRQRRSIIPGANFCQKSQHPTGNEANLQNTTRERSGLTPEWTFLDRRAGPIVPLWVQASSACEECALGITLLAWTSVPANLRRVPCN